MKIYNQGKLIRDTDGRFSSFKSKLSKIWFWTKVTTLVSAFLFLAGVIGAASYSTSTVSASTTIVEAQAPILDRIASCEGKAQLGPSGQVIIHINSNGTYDIGKYQINSIHNAEATKLGFNLMTEEGNYGYAKYLYANKGTGDWASSSKCWMR